MWVFKIFYCVLLSIHLSRADILGRIKISQLPAKEGDELHQGSKILHLEICGGASKDSETWTLHSCLSMEEIGSKIHSYLPIESDKISTHLLILVKTSEKGKIESATPTKISSRQILQATRIPLMFPNEQTLTTVELAPGIKFQIALECVEKQYGPRCQQYCDSSKSNGRFACHPQTGEIICSFGWIGKECAEHIFIDRNDASEFLKSRPKRSNDREDCSKGKCTAEEQRDEFLQHNSELSSEDDGQHTGGESLSSCEGYCNETGTIICLRGEGGEHMCKCEPGYRGKTCSDIDRCYAEPCHNGGTCEDTDEGIVCDCPEGYKGTFCEILENLCLENPCGNDGECLPTTTGFSCLCEHGFTGDLCEVNIDDCPEEACSGRGTCQDGLNTYFCQCDEGYFGKDCEMERYPCQNEPCENGGTCINFEDGYFECFCPDGYEGKTCSHKIKDPCVPDPCNGNGQCHGVFKESSGMEFMYLKTAVCFCDYGYAGHNCEIALTTCESVEFPCPLNSTCINLESEYICACPPGFEGSNCEIECDQCEERNDLLCENDPCQNGARCLLVNGSSTCICSPGFFGEKCEKEFDFCENVTCGHGECVSSSSDFECFCEPGYKGQFCDEDIDECEYEYYLCKNGGQCKNTQGGYKCLCLKGFEGEHCDHKIDACSSQTCLNGGTCAPDDGGTFQCFCKIGYVGFTCERIFDLCLDHEDYCLNGGKCIVADPEKQEIKCECADRYHGDNCETEIPVCQMKLEKPDGSFNIVERAECGSYGRCVPDFDEDFKCECVEGYGGKFCDHKTEKVTDCTDVYCVCDSGLPNYKALPVSSHHLSRCSHPLYGDGRCVLDECLSQNCTDSSQLVCQYQSECLSKGVLPRRAHGTEAAESCDWITLYFDRQHLPQNSTVQKVCEVLRKVPTVVTIEDSVIKCKITTKTEASVGVVISVASTDEYSSEMMKSKLYTFFTNWNLNDISRGLNDDEFDIIRSAVNISTAHSHAVTGWSNWDSQQTDTPDFNIDKEPAKNYQKEIIIGVVVAIVAIALLALALGWFIWSKKHKPVPSPVPDSRRSENNNIPINSVVFSKSSDGKVTSFKNPLKFGVVNDGFASCENEQTTPTMQQRIEEGRNEVETPDRQGVTTFAPQNLCKEPDNNPTQR